MTNANHIRVVALLEANYVTGAAKAVLEYAREAMGRQARSPMFEVTAIVFRRGDSNINASLTSAMSAINLQYETIEEQHAFDSAIVLQLRSIVEKVKPDLIWTNSVKSHFLLRLTGLSKKVPWVAYHHGYTTTNLKMMAYNQLDRWSLSGANRIITVCEAFADELVSLGIAREKMVVQGMPIRVFEPAPKNRVDELRIQLGLKPDVKVILNIGRFSREKGHRDLIHAFATLCRIEPNPLHLVIVGEGPERKKVSELIRNLRIAHKVTLTGQQEDVRPYLGLAEVFVLPSHSEGTPNTILEAMAAGIPVVATAVGGVPRLTDGGAAAVLAKRGDIDGIATAVSRLLNDPRLRAQVINGGAIVVENNTPDKYFEALSDIFQRLASPRP